jgi:hypothetical protein
MNDPIQQLQAEFQALRAGLHQEIQSLQNEIQTLRATLSIIANTTTTTRPRAVLPIPTKFDGKQYRFKTWLPTIKAKIAVDGQAIGDETAKFYFVWDNLEPSIQAMVLPQLANAEENGQWNWEEIIHQLERVYTNPNETREAQQAIHKVKQQENEQLTAYIARFERILHEAKGRDWPPAVKISTFRQGLNASIQRALDSQLQLPDQYPEFLQATQRLATRSATYSGSRTAPTTQHDKMDLSAVGINTVELATVDTRAKAVSPQQREQWRRAGCCVRCGSQNHWVQSCPKQSTLGMLTNSDTEFAPITEEDYYVSSEDDNCSI